MASTFSPNYGLELIGTGEQQGVWGITTNETYKRVEQMIGAHAELDIDALPSASTLSGTDPEVLNWITTQTAPAGADNSEGRCPCVTITSSDDVGENNLDVKVFGTSISHNPDRLFVVNNQLSDSRSLKIISGTGGGGTVTVPNGKSAMVYTKGSANKAVNVLENYSLASLDFTVDGDGEIIIDDSDAAALVIKDSAGVAYQTFNTTAGKIVLEQDTETASGKDLGTTGAGTITSDGLLTASNGLTVTTGTVTLTSITASAASSISILDSTADALDITESTNSYLTFDTSNKKLIIGEETSDVETLDIDTDDISVATQPTSILVKDDEAASLDIKEGSTSYLAIDTSDDTEGVVVGKELRVDAAISSKGATDLVLHTNSGTDSGIITVTDGADGAITLAPNGAGITSVTTDLRIEGSDGYLNFDTTTGSDGIGIRNNSGVMESKSSGDDWGAIVGGSFFEHEFSAVLAAGVSQTESHGLGSTPRIVMWALKAQSSGTLAGYSVGDEIQFAACGADTATRDSIDHVVGPAGWISATQVGYKVAQFGFLVINKSSGVPSSATGFKVIVRAWK